MCTVSNIGSGYGQTFPDHWPRWVPAHPLPKQRPLDPAELAKLLRKPDDVTREEFEALKKELEALRELIVAAKKFDAATGQRDCEMADKVALFKKLAEIVGVDLSDLLK